MQAPPKALNRDDFDGDGRPDLLLQGLYRKPGAKLEFNRSLLLGSAGGAAAGRQVSLTDRLPKGSQGMESYGQTSELTGDWDADGHADILFSTRMDTTGDADQDRRPYREQIFWGGKGGVDGTRTRLPASDAPYVAAGDFDGDGVLDLVSGQHKAVEDRRNPVRCAAIHFGPFDRDGRPEERRYADITQHGAVINESLTAGDFDGDGREEFFTNGFRVEGEEVPGESLPDIHVDASYYRVGRDRSVVRAGGLKVFEGGKEVLYDPEGGGNRIRDGVGEVYPITTQPAELSQRLTADFGGNGRTDVVFDGPGADGRQVVYGGPAGPGTGRAATYAPEETDTSVVGDVNGDGRDDLVSAVEPARPGPAVSVAVFLGGKQGLAYQAAYWFDRADLGIPPAPEKSPRWFGNELALADLDGDGCDDLAVRARNFGDGDGTRGVYSVIPGSLSGPVTARAQRLEAWRIGRG